ncbi:MAG: glycosyltransferase family 4 protein [Planctomycetota bacterium]
MRITWLLEATDRIWGGVKVALEDANWLCRRGHDVLVLSRTNRPDWMEIECAFEKLEDFTAASVPASDVVIGTYWTTVPKALFCGRGAPVHFCQGYEGANPENAPIRGRIEEVYRLPCVHHVTISPHLTATLASEFGIEAREIVYAIDRNTHYPCPEREVGEKVRVALVGPREIPWKDIETGIEACRAAHAAGLDLELVRVTNTRIADSEREQPFAVELHQNVPPSEMGEIYRSCDLFLGTSWGPEEGFFLPAVEAMACGVPAVLTDIPCYRSYGEGGYALFVPPRDPIAMAEAMVAAARLPAVRSALRANGLAAASRFTIEAHGTELENALLAIASDRAAHEERASMFFGVDRIDEALWAMEAALAAGADASAYNRLGVLLARKGDRAGAKRSFQLARSLDPGNADALANLAAL